MPFLKHIVQPLLKQELDNIHAELPPPQALGSTLGPRGRGDTTAPQGVDAAAAYTGPGRKGGQQVSPDRSPMAPDDQLEQYVADKQAAYKKQGATPEQLASWEKYDRNRFTSFLNKQQMVDMTAAAHEPALHEALGHAAVGVGDAARAASGRSYLQSIAYTPPTATPAGTAKTPYDPRGLVKKGGTKDFDPRVVDEGSFVSAMGGLQKLGPAWDAFQRGAYTGKDQGVDDSGRSAVVPIPNADVAEPAAAKKKGKRVVLDLPAGPIGVAEDGQAIDKRGKKLGYLQQQAIVTPYGDVPMRAADRKPADVSPAEPSSDAFSDDVMRRRYKEHLDVFEENRGSFPRDYFKGKSKKEREDIKQGVEALRARQYGTRT